MRVNIQTILSHFGLDTPNNVRGLEFEEIGFSSDLNASKLNGVVVIINSSYDTNYWKNCLLLEFGHLAPRPNFNYHNNIKVEFWNNPDKVLNDLIKLGVNVPAGIDEMLLRSNQYPTLNSNIERCLHEEFPSYIGYNTHVGISGDIRIDDTSETAISIGAVKLGKNVHIGSNVLIYRGLTSYTEIADNTWVDDGVIIHHDSKVSGFVTKDTYESN